MQPPTSSFHRRAFLNVAATLAGGALLWGCGGGDVGVANDPVAPIGTGNAAAATSTGGSPRSASQGSPINAALLLTYLCAEYYGTASQGTDIAASSTSANAALGTATGGRCVRFADETIARIAAELAADKLTHVVLLRNLLGPSAAARPAIDLSVAPTGAFTKAAQASGLVPPGDGFDPYVDDTSFLIGAFLIENRVAAAYRYMLSEAPDSATGDLLAANLSDAIFHGGVIRTLLAAEAATQPTVDVAIARITCFLAVLDGSNAGDHSLAAATGQSVDLADADGRPIPFLRAIPQILTSMVLSDGKTGGFFPEGIDGVTA